MLIKIYKRALKAGGRDMPAARYAKVFGNDSCLRRNVLRACGNARYGAAIVAGTVGDHRVFEALNRMGTPAARMVLDLEARLGRKLGRSKAHQLAAAYLRVSLRRRRFRPGLAHLSATAPAAPTGVAENVIRFQRARH